MFGMLSFVRKMGYLAAFLRDSEAEDRLVVAY